MATKNNRRTLMTKKLLKDSLLELLHEKRIEQVTIKELCQLADLNRSTFYLHYQDQYQLLYEIQGEIIDNTVETLSNIKEVADSTKYVEAFLQYIKDNKYEFEVMLSNSYSEFEDLMAKASLQTVIANSMLPANSDEDIIIFTFIMSGSISVIKEWLNNDCNPDIKKTAATIFKCCNSLAALTNLA